MYIVEDLDMKNQKIKERRIDHCKKYDPKKKFFKYI